MRPVHYLAVFIPAAIALELAHATPLLVFSAAALGVIPCAAVMGEATEAIAARTGPGIGGLLNVTFGNAPELIIAFFALELAHASPLIVFSAAALGVIPCAAVMGEATEAIAAKSGPGIGGLLNVTFGNAPELIIAFFALLEGLQEVVRRQSSARSSATCSW